MSDTDAPQGLCPIPTNERMIKEETVKDDGRTLIYYTFPDAGEAPAAVNPLSEAAHV